MPLYDPKGTRWASYTTSLGSWSLLALALCPFNIYASSCERFAPPSDARVVSHDQPEPHALPHGFDNHQGAPSVRWLSNVYARVTFCLFQTNY